MQKNQVTVCVSSSCKFANKWEEIKVFLESDGAKVCLPSDTAYEDSGVETESIKEKRQLMDEYNEFVNQADILYVYAPNGYVGVGVAMEIGYAHALEKEIISSEEIEEIGPRVLVSKVMSPEELKKYIGEKVNV